MNCPETQTFTLSKVIDVGGVTYPGATTTYAMGPTSRLYPTHTDVWTYTYSPLNLFRGEIVTVVSLISTPVPNMIRAGERS